MAKLPSIQEMEIYIREAAIKRGIDPDIAVRVAKSEGLQKGTWQSNYVKNGVREPSYGPFQLYKGGGLGNRMQAQTGLDPADTANWKPGVDFALDDASKNKSWAPWYGAARVGIPNNAGFNGKGLASLPQSPSQGASPPPPPPPMARMQPGMSSPMVSAQSAPQPGFGSPMMPGSMPRQGPQMTASVNPMQGAPGTPYAQPKGLAGLFGPKPGGASPMGGMAQALMSGMGGMAQPQQQMAPANFVVPAAEPGMLNPTPQGLADPRMAALLKLLQQQQA